MQVNNFFADNADLFGWQDLQQNVQAWKPDALAHDAWPPDYKAVYAWRLKTLQSLRGDEKLLASAKAYYRHKPKEFIMHWMDTYDPRKKTGKWMPFVFFTKQAEFIDFLDELRNAGESGLTEKCRDAGATWCACAYSVHSLLFIDNDAIGWGSRKQDLVDKIGDPDSIFEKMRLILKRLPDIFTPTYDAPFMKIVNHDNGAIISGEAGDNIGRGGRKSMYFKDESAHYERPEKIEAAVGDNTNVQVDISSVNGLGNVFHRRREQGINWQPSAEMQAGFTQVFVIDWRDHPDKTQQWYDDRKAKAEREGMLHVFAQEVDRDYSAAVQNTIIPLAWINACVDAHLKMKWYDEHGNLQIGYEPKNVWGAGLDVADGGIDRNAIAVRQDIVWRDAEEWGERDPGVTTRRAHAALRNIKKVTVQYDCIGVGASVKSEYNRWVDEKLIDPAKLSFVPWHAGASVQNPFDNVIPDDDESPMNRDFYGNLKAQAWGAMRARCYKTFKNITAGDLYPVDQMVSLDSRMKLLEQIKKELAQAVKKDNGSLKQIVDKQPAGTKSPNVADAGIMMYFPVDEDHKHVVTGTRGG